jgi:hypothetical protein
MFASKRVAAMLKTIRVGNYLLIQGQFVRSLKDGRVEVKVYEETFVGWPVVS